MQREEIDTIVKSTGDWLSAPDLAWAPLDGGLSNETYKVTARGKDFVLRVHGTQNEYLGLDRMEEARAMRIAHEAGIAPEVFLDLCTDKIMVTAFQPGGNLLPEHAHTPGMIKKLAHMLKSVHAIGGVNRRCTVYHLIYSYMESAAGLGVLIPDPFREYLDKVKSIERRRREDPLFGTRYCHNDFFTINIIENGTLHLIDWELSGRGDQFCDLSTIAYTCNWSVDEEELLLQEYFGVCSHGQLDTLHDLRFVNLVREAAWALLHQAIIIDPVNHTFDYKWFVQHVLQRLGSGKLTLWD